MKINGDVFNVTAFSRGYELRNKMLYEFTEDSIGIVELANKILEKTRDNVKHYSFQSINKLNKGATNV